jgi:hypothetical protein
MDVGGINYHGQGLYRSWKNGATFVAVWAAYMARRYLGNPFVDEKKSTPGCQGRVRSVHKITYKPADLASYIYSYIYGETLPRFLLMSIHQLPKFLIRIRAQYPATSFSHISICPRSARVR